MSVDVKRLGVAAGLTAVTTALAVFSGCKIRQATVSAISADAPATAEGDRPPLAASDLAILIPISATADGDDVYGMKGTGVCNMPRFSDGATDDPILPLAMFRQFSRDVFKVITPLPDVNDRQVWRSAPTADELRRNDPATVGDAEQCTKPPFYNRLNQANEPILLQTSTHLAAMHGVQREACAYDSWRIVSVRFEPCPHLPDFFKAGATDIPGTDFRRYSLDACGKPELRVTAQAFKTLEKDLVVDSDMAMHLFFKLDAIEPILVDLRKLAATTKRARTAGAAKLAALPDDVKGNWQTLDPKVLTPHPGLHLEMDCGDATTGPRGDVAKDLFALLANHARSKNLVKITWMTSNDGSHDRWTMGTRIVTQGRIESDVNFRNENFSNVRHGFGEFPFSPMDRNLNTIAGWYPMSKLTDATEGPKRVTKENFQELYDLVNPLKINFNFGGKKGGSCLSCHLRDQTAANVSRTLAQTDLATFAKSKGATDLYPTPTIWPVFRASIEARAGTMRNLRNFGYGPDLSLGVSTRAIHEVDLARDFVARFLSGGPNTGGTTGGSDGGNNPPPQVGTAWSVFDNNCTQCHSEDTGREPKFTEASIERYTPECRREILRRTAQIAFRQRNHMPPNGTLKAEELTAVRIWAGNITGTIEAPADGGHPCQTPVAAAPTTETAPVTDE